MTLSKRVPETPDRMRNTTTTAGTGNMTLVPVIGYNDLAGLDTETRVYYSLAHRITTEWEVGIGYINTGDSTFVRETVLSNHLGTGNKINFSAGTKDIFATIPADLVRVAALPTHNLLINGGFDFFQRTNPASATSISDDFYGPDRWYVLTQTASIQIQRTTGTDASRNALRMTQNQASAQRMGIAQIVESVNSRPGTPPFGNVVFQGAVKVTGEASTIRVAILKWTGTADTVTSDVVNDWTSSTFTAGQFFNSTTLEVVATSNFQTGVTAGFSVGEWYEFVLRGEVSATDLGNLIVMVWTEDVKAQNVTLDLTECALHYGNVARYWVPRPYAEELALCQRYFEKSCAVDQVLGNNTFLADTRIVCACYATNQVQGGQPFKVKKRANANMTLYRDNIPTSSADGRWGFNSGGSWVTPGSDPTIVAERDQWYMTQTNVTATAGHAILASGHWSASAEL